MIINFVREDLEVYSLFILGACFGSFLNVLILRLPKGLNVVTLKSHCPKCKENLKWFHNIPLLSFIFLRGKCFFCKDTIALQYFFVELITAFLTVFIYLKTGLNIDFFLISILFYVLIVLAFIDLKYKAVPDYILLIALIWVFITQHDQLLEALKNAALFAGVFSLLEFFVTFYIQNIKVKITKDESLKEAKSLGEGDIPIVAIIGALLGVTSGMFAIFLAAFFAIIPSLYASIKNEDPQTPFIPYLLLGLCVEYLFEISKVFI